MDLGWVYTLLLQDRKIYVGWTAHDNLARIYLERGDFVNAKAEFLRALEIDPQNRNLLMGLRSLYDRRGETGEAMKIEQRIRAIERDERL